MPTDGAPSCRGLKDAIAPYTGKQCLEREFQQLLVWTINMWRASAGKSNTRDYFICDLEHDNRANRIVNLTRLQTSLYVAARVLAPHPLVQWQLWALDIPPGKARSLSPPGTYYLTWRSGAYQTGD